MAEPALAGLRVLDLAGGIPGPYAARILADLGAEVLKVEPPAGDPARAAGPFPGDIPHPERSGLFLYLNLNKRGATLNRETRLGRQILLRLAGAHDLVFANFAPPVGLPAHVVWCAITAFGLSGPRAGLPGTELTEYASGGLQYMSGEFDREPLKHGGSQARYLAAGHAAVAALAAAREARQTGQGRFLDLSVQECMASCLQGKLCIYSYTGGIQRRDPRLGGAARSGILPAADGYIASVLMSGASTDWDTYSAFVNAQVEAPELLNPVYDTPEGRIVHLAELEPLLLDAFRQRGKHHWFHEAQAWRLPFGIVQTAADLANCPQLESRAFWVEVAHPEAPTLRYPGVPYHTTAPSFAVRRPAPLLGQDNAAVYCGELGFSRAQLVRLREAGIV